MIEHEIWEDNPHQYVIGADEVGRGSIAGPIVAASVRIAYKDNKYLESKATYSLFSTYLIFDYSIILGI